MGEPRTPTCLSTIVCGIKKPFVDAWNWLITLIESYLGFVIFLLGIASIVGLFIIFHSASCHRRLDGKLRGATAYSQAYNQSLSVMVRFKNDGILIYPKEGALRLKDDFIVPVNSFVFMTFDSKYVSNRKNIRVTHDQRQVFLDIILNKDPCWF